MEQIVQIDAAFQAGDLAALRAAVDSPAAIPNGPMPVAIGRCLEYSIYHSPISFIQELLEIGADPNPAEHDGFPPLIAVLSNRTRPDAREVVALLLSYDADPNQRGINDYTPLHVVAEEGDLEMVELLLSAGADPHLRTRIDDLETPLELAEKAGHAEIVEWLRVRMSGPPSEFGAAGSA